MTTKQDDLPTSSEPKEVHRIDNGESRPHAPEPPPRGLASGVSNFTRRFRWPLLVGWIVLLAGAGVSSISIGEVLSGGGWYVPGSQSKMAATELAAANMAGRGQTAVALVVRDRTHTAEDPAFEARVRNVVAAVSEDARLKTSGSYGWTTLSAASRDQFLGGDRRTAVIGMALGLDDGAARRELPLAQDALTSRFEGRGLQVSLVSPASLWGAVNSISQKDLVKAELVTFPLIVLILLVIYRSAVAALASLAVGVTAIVLTLGALTPVAHQVELSIFLENTATMLGLGVGVDYSLFVISRFKRELAGGRDVTDAVTETLRTSGHTVLFSGITVFLTMSALFMVNLSVIQSIALGAITVVAFSVFAATIFLPVLLHLLGHRINKV